MQRRPPPIKVSNKSRSIVKKPVLSKPVIIHTYSPKVIQTDAENFMSLVQRLTGLSETGGMKSRKSKSQDSQMKLVADPFQCTPTKWSPIPTPNLSLQQEFLKDLPQLVFKSEL